jgi:hypothetical protein
MANPDGGLLPKPTLITEAFWQHKAEQQPIDEPFETKNKVGPYRQWSPSAVACYARQANCDGCYYKTFFAEAPQGCQMAEAVIHLIKKLGHPTKRHLNKVH